MNDSFSIYIPVSEIKPRLFSGRIGTRDNGGNWGVLSTPKRFSHQSPRKQSRNHRENPGDMNSPNQTSIAATTPSINAPTA